MTSDQIESQLIGLLAPHITGFISIKGEDAAKFLQGQLTCDVIKIKDNSLLSLGAYCNIKGKIQSLFRIFFAFDGYYLWLPQEEVTSTVNLLKKYAVFSKVKIEDVSATYTIVGCNVDDVISSYALNDKLSVKDDMVILPIHSEVIGFFGQKIHLETYLTKLSSKYSEVKYTDFSTLLSTNILHKLDIEKGIPFVTTQTKDVFLPHSLNLPQLNGVSFSKGCYLGQEIIARMHYKGQSKQQMYHVLIESPTLPKIGEKVVDNEAGDQDAPGIVIDACPENENKYHALLCLRISSSEHINVLQLPECQGRIAQSIPLIFPDRE